MSKRPRRVMSPRPEKELLDRLYEPFWEKAARDIFTEIKALNDGPRKFRSIGLVKAKLIMAYMLGRSDQAAGIQLLTTDLNNAHEEFVARNDDNDRPLIPELDLAPKQYWP